MKSTTVDADGTVRCPVCGGTSFREKRTGRAKWLGGGVAVATVGLAIIPAAAGVAAMPKRLKCDGCGENLKRAGGERLAPAPPVTTPRPPTRSAGTVNPGRRGIDRAPIDEANLARIRRDLAAAPPKAPSSGPRTQRAKFSTLELRPDNTISNGTEWQRIENVVAEIDPRGLFLTVSGVKYAWRVSIKIKQRAEAVAFAAAVNTAARK